MTKRILAILLAALMLFLCACNDGTVPDADSTPQPSENSSELESNDNNDSSEPKIIRITCWGDSITEGMSMKAGETYPDQLAKMLGEGYEVLNGGDGGENSFTIAARQGAYKLFATRTLKFPVGVTSVDIGTTGTGLDFAAEDGQRLKLLGLLGNKIDINDVTINGEKYKIEFKNGSYSWGDKNSNEFVLTRLGSADEEAVILKNTEVILNGTQSSDIQIYYIGCNNKAPYKTSEAIIADLKAMIAHHGSDNYLVIIPHWTNEHDSAFIAEFGDRAINLRLESVKNGLTFEGLTPTQTDNDLIAQGLMPASLRYQNSDNDVHLNAYGYHFLAHLIHQRGQTLKLW